MACLFLCFFWVRNCSKGFPYPLCQSGMVTSALLSLSFLHTPLADLFFFVVVSFCSHTLSHFNVLLSFLYRSYLVCSDFNLFRAFFIPTFQTDQTYLGLSACCVCKPKFSPSVPLIMKRCSDKCIDLRCPLTTEKHATANCGRGCPAPVFKVRMCRETFMTCFNVLWRMWEL